MSAISTMSDVVLDQTTGNSQQITTNSTPITQILQKL